MNPISHRDAMNYISIFHWTVGSTAILVAAATLLTFTPISWAAEAFYPLVRYANEPADLYQQPSTDARVSIELEKGARLVLVAQEGDWFMARLSNDRVGWIHGKFLTGSPPALPQPATEPKPEPAQNPKLTAHKKAAEPETLVQPEKKPDQAETLVQPEEKPDQTETVAQDERTVKVDSGRIRSDPSLDAPVQFGVTRGEKVVVMESKDEWRHIRLPDGRTGWGHRMLFSKTDPDQPDMEDGLTPKNFDGDRREADKKILQTIIAVTDDADEEKVLFQLGGFFPPETFVIDEGDPKVVCDFKGISPAEDLEKRIPVNGTMIRQIRVGVHSDPDAKVRVVVDLMRENTYSVEQVFIKGKGQYILTFRTTDG